MSDLNATGDPSARSTIRPEDSPGDPVTYGPYNSTTATGTFKLTPAAGSGGALVKEYHGTEPVLQLLMNDGRLSKPYYGGVARNNRDWNLTAVKSADAAGNLISVVFFSLTSHTRWTTLNPQDGAWLHRNGYTLTFRRGSQELLTVDPGPDFGGGGGDICDKTSTIKFPHFQIVNQAFDVMDNVVVFAKADQFWACKGMPP
jgi:hypothetical protein